MPQSELRRDYRSQYLLVDGYNIIFAWDELSALAERSLEDARIRLMDILCDYKGFTGYEVILVFDAHKVRKNPGSVERYINIVVVYTKEAESADNYIERTASALAKRDRVVVATSDNLEQMIILSHGAERLTAVRLLEDVRAVRRTACENFILNKPVKNNMLLDNMDEQTIIELERMRRSR